MTRGADLENSVVCAVSMGLVLALLGAPSPSSAADAPLADEPAADEPLAEGFDDALEQDLELLEDETDDVVVSAAKHRQSLFDAPAAVTVITAAEIAHFGWRTLGEAVASAAGFYYHTDRLYGYLGVRGYSVSGDWNSKVLVLINGHAMSGNVYYDALVDSAFSLALDDVSRIEIVRGPGSALYGTNAFFAVINVITRRGEEIDGVEATAAASSYGTWTGRASGGKRFASGAEVSLSFTGELSQGDRSLYIPDLDVTARDVDGERGYKLWGQASWGPWSLQASRSIRHRDYPGAYYGARVGSLDNFALDERDFVELGWAPRLSDDLDARVRAYWDRTEYQADSRFDYPDEGAFDVANRDLGEGQKLGAEAQAAYRWGDLLRLTAGGAAEHHFAIVQRTEDAFYGMMIDDERGFEQLSGYVDAELAPLATLRFFAGARYDHYSHFGGALSPRGAVVWRPNADVTLKAIYGESYRAPTMFELYYAANNFAPSRITSPERIRTAELIYEHVLDDGLTFTSAGYYNHLSGLIGETENDDGVPYYANLADCEAFGLELTLRKRWSMGATFQMSYSLQRARYDAPQALPRKAEESTTLLTNSPEHLAAARGSYPLLDGRLFLSGELRYSSSRLTIGGADTRGIIDLNLGVVMDVIPDALRVGAYAHNLLDWTDGVPAPPEWDGIDQMPQLGQAFSLRITGRL